MTKEFKIRKPTDPIEIKNIIVMIFGEPGMGKTSLSFTAESPLHLDYDRGYHRSVGQKDSLEITNWQDGIDLLESNYIEENGVKTLVIDTVGTMLDDFAADFVIKENSKNGKSGGGLALQGYGALKEKFRHFKMLAQNKGLDLVFLCHTDEEKDNDIIKKIPKITGGSYDILKAASDLIGFMEVTNGKRTLDFNSTDRHDGKNCPEFQKMELPHYTDAKWATFLGDIIAKTKQKMNSMSESSKKALNELNDLREQIKGIESLDNTFEAMQTKINSMAPAIKIQCQKLLDDKYTEIWAREFMYTYTSPADLSKVLENIKSLEQKFHVELKRKLVDYSEKLGLVWSKESNSFVHKEEPAKKEKKNVDILPENDIKPVQQTESSGSNLKPGKDF